MPNQKGLIMQSGKLIVSVLIALFLAAGLLLVGCEGEAGPAGAQGPQGPQGPTGPTGPGFAAGFMGNNEATCGHCHSSVTAAWLETGHANAYVSLAASDTNNYCLQCHTTGFDDTYDHSGVLLTTGTDSTGYDNLRTAGLTGVQCESCHGAMGGNPASHAPQIAAAMSGATCANCHEQGEETAESGHGTAIATAGGIEAFLDEFGGSNCQVCHVSEGFIKAKDTDYAGADVAMTNGINCATCHDPHEDANAAQLRTLADATSPYSAIATTGYTITGLGIGQACAQCHHARRSESQINGQLTNGSAHPGPHESPQTDMYMGQGSWEIADLTYERRDERVHQNVTTMADACVSCHMYTVARAPGVTPEFGHTFEPDTRKCAACHDVTNGLDINSIQTETEDLLTQLAALLPHDTTGAVMSAMDTLSWTREQREAGYAYMFVEADGSKGVHNPVYSRSLLENAISYLTPTP